ncbi:aminotransferase-like domain-containing protein [Brachybacterium sp. DNPG3]
MASPLSPLSPPSPLAPLPAPPLVPLLGAPPAEGRTEWLTARLVALATEGRLAPGMRLPSERRLAEQLGLSRGTVVRALDAARDRGVLASRQGSGRVVLAPPGRSRPVESLTARTQSPPAGTVDLRATVLPPHPRLQEVAEAAVGDLVDDAAWGSVPADGLPELVEAICAHYARRGLPTEPEQVLVTTGAVSGLHLALRAVTSPGARVGTENPGYPNTARVIAAARRRPVPLDVADAHGEVLVRAVGSGALDAAVLTPDFHNPGGRLLGAADRSRLLRAAASTGTPLLIDETLTGMAWRPGILPPAPVAGSGARTVLVGSVSKSLWAGLRIGWIRTAPEIADAISRIRLGVDLGAPPLEQRIAARLLSAPDPDVDVDDDAGRSPAVPAHRAHIAASYEVAAGILRERLPHWEWREPDGGLSIWATGTRRPAAELVEEAGRRGVALSPGALFSPSGTGWPHALRIPFSGRADELRRGLEVLAEIEAEGPGR